MSRGKDAQTVRCEIRDQRESTGGKVRGTVGNKSASIRPTFFSRLNPLDEVQLDSLTPKREREIGRGNERGGNKKGRKWAEARRLIRIRFGFG